MTLSETLIRAAVLHARLSAHRDMPMTACPYVGDDDDKRALRQVWVRAYLAIRPPAPGAVDYTDESPVAE